MTAEMSPQAISSGAELKKFAHPRYWKMPNRAMIAIAADDAVSIRRIGIEQVNAFVLQCRHDVLPNHRNGSVEAVLQAGQASLLSAAKNVFEHHALVRSEVRSPCVLRLQQMKNVVFVDEEQDLFIRSLRS